MLSKTNLRQNVKQRIKLMTMKERLRASHQVLKRLEENQHFQEAHVVMLFYSLPDEVCTHDFIQNWSRYKRILLPRVEGDEIIPSEYVETKLTQGAYGIMEPLGGNSLISDIQLVVVPGVAFDRSGNRLGRGKGYYDRFLSQGTLQSVYKIGICFPCQLVENVPTEMQDIRMNEVIDCTGI